MTKEIKSVEQTGALERLPHPDDYVAGEGGIEIADRLSGYNWFKYKSLGERQYDLVYKFDTFSCVSFAGNNVVETQINYLLAKKLLPKRTVDFINNNGFIPKGETKVKLSNRFIAIKSGTTEDGNYWTAVAKTLRKVGAIPETMLPFGGKNQKEYLDPKVIIQEMDDLALEFLTHFTIRYGWVIAMGKEPRLRTEAREKMFKEIRKAPLQRLANGHSTMFYGAVHKQKWLELETYKPFDREKPWDFDPPYVGIILVEPKNEFTFEEVKIARARVKKVIVDQHGVNKFFRSEVENGAHGEAYWINFDGSFEYETAKGTMYGKMIKNSEIISISEVEWQKLKPAEIK